MPKFNIGDIVMVDTPNRLWGKNGLVVGYGSTPGNVGVEFNENIDGHDCRKKAKYGYGYYVHERELKRIYARIR